jgi:putative flippase GtrA
MAGVMDLARRHEQKLRYLAVSAWNYVFGNIVYIGLVTLVGRSAVWWHVPAYVWMIVPANVVGITNNFLGFKFFVFRTKGDYLGEYFRSYVVYAPMVLVQMVALPALVTLTHLDPRIANPVWGVLAFVIAFFAHRFFTFKTPPEQLEQIDELESQAS